MEKAKTFCRKKRNLAKSMLSFMLVFAMVISNVQITPDAFSTVWAAENETLETSEASENSSQPSESAGDSEEAGETSENSGDDRNSEEIGETQKSPDSEEMGNEERSETAAESTQTAEREQSEETSEGGNTETTASSSVETETASQTETVTETETVTATESETEATEEEMLEEGAEGEAPSTGQISIKLHFKDVLGWDTAENDIQVAYASYKNEGSEWITTDYDDKGKWPGVALTEVDGYYTLELDKKPTYDGLVFVFHNKKDDVGLQTDDYVIPIDAFSDDVTEYWIFAAKADNYGKHPAQICSKAIDTPTISPEIGEDGKVTFRYFNCFETSTVKVAGDMTSWGDNAIKMMDEDNSGIYTATTDVLEAKEYGYKFILGESTWITDPNNDSYDDRGNSKFTIEGEDPDKIISPEVNGNKVTFRYKNSEADVVYVRGTMNDWVDNETYKMTKNETTGIHTLEVEMSHGSYEYKFHYEDGTKDGVWLPDPNGQQVEGTKPDRNSIVYVPGIEEYTYTIHYYNPGVDIPTQVPSEGSGPDLHIWDMCPGAAEGQEYAFEALTEDEDKDKGKTWLTATVKVPFPHINIIARPTGGWVEGVKEKEWTYELKKDAKTAELWFVYGEGLYENNPFLETYKYTIHYYNPATPNQESSTPDLYIWGADTANPGKLYSYAEEKLNDTDNGIQWMTTEVDTPYEKIGLIGKTATGDNEAGWAGKDKDRFYQIKKGEKTAELWYVHGVGVYDKKPMMKLNSVGAALSVESIDYTQNSVLSLVFNGDKSSKVLIKSASVDASALGISDNLTIDPQLCEVTLSVRDNIEAGTYQLPVTVEGVTGTKLTAEASVTVKEKTGSDFDWDEAVIYFMVTDRFFDGDSSNNAANGADTTGDNAGLYHGGDFKGVTEKLDYLKELGVNTIWITPIVENIKGVTVGDGTGDVPFYAAYHGYWASDFTKLNPALGTEAEFQTLIDTAHEKGMKIMVDVVVNHAGYGMEETDQFPGMLRDKADVNEEDHELGGYQAGLPDFLTELPEVRNKIIQWQVDWAKKGVDFFRVDTVQHVEDTTWRAFKNELTKANPKFKMIGEYFGAGYNSNNGNRIGNGQMDSLLDFDFNDWATEFVGGGILSVEKKLADRNKALNNTYLTGQFLSSHDENGFQAALIDKGWSKADAAAAAYAAATLQITAKGQPVIYYGEEIGLTGMNDYPKQTNRYDFDWTELETQKTTDNSIYNHYKKMLSIRSEYADVFAKGTRQSVSGTNADKYDVFSRSYNKTTLYVGINIDINTGKEVSFAVNNSGITAYRDLYSNQEYTVSEDGKVTITIPAAKNGGTIVLVPSSYEKGLIAPTLTIAKGKATTLPEKLTYMSENGEETLVAVTYSMDKVEGVTLDAASRKITVAETFAGKTIDLTATAGEESIKFTVKVVEDKNQITLRLHYHRPDGNYENWNVWSWRVGSEGKQYDFDSEDENGAKVVTFELEGRSTSVLNYIIRKSTSTDPWGGGKDFPEDCFVDLSDILSGTVDYYVESGVFPGTRILGDDVFLGVKILSVKYNSAKNVIKVVTGTPITGGTDGIFTLKRADGTEIVITGVRLASADKNEYELSLGSDLSGMEAVTKKYSLFYDEYEYPVEMPSLYSSDAFEQEFTYTGDDLGATWTSSKTTFKVWAPTADSVKVNLYTSGTEGADDLIETLSMKKGEKGVWSVQKAGDLNGVYYTYSVDVDGTTAEACDPYARTTGVNGNRAMVINLNATNPAGWSTDRGPNAGMTYTDSIIYELHVRDFSIDESSGIQNKGKFLGLTEKGTKNASGQTTGLDYLTDLGVTHIHLLPSYDYAPVDETKLDTPQYNWGYDPKNYNVPEGSYSTDPYNGAVRVKEMKQMVKTLHDNNINVIMDVVYNHVYDADKFSFNQLVPKYFSRTNADGSYSSGSGCGNDTASERSMVKKYIVDSVNYWADEYHIDGFRFDLVGLLDVDTINEVVNTVHETHPDVVFYGEGWKMDTAVSKDDVIMATQWTSEKTPKFAYFSDTIRNLLKGDTFSHESTGFVSGATGQEELLAKCFTGATDWCKSPTQTVNYASCHDNYSLMDKLSVSRKDASFEDKTKMNNLAAAIYMTSEGIPLIHAAEELLREKIDENGNPVENSYKSSDLVNSIKWSNLDKENYRNVRDYYKGLIAFRKNHAALRLTTAAEVKANVQYKWISEELVMFVINGKDSIADEVSDGIVVIFNANTAAKDVDMYSYGVPQGTWNICINDQKAGIETLAAVTDGKVKVAPISALVLVKGETKDNESVYDKNEQQKIEKLKKELEALILQYEKEEQGERTDESWAAFQTALQAAKEVVGKIDVTLNELNLAISNLQAAHDALTTPEGTVDKEKLKALVALYDDIFNAGQGDYTDESWKAFSDELANAEALLEKSDATQAEIDEAYSKLETAYTNLTSTKNTEKLDELIAECSKLDKGDYTDESWNALQEALKAAKEIADKPNATQAEIDKAEQDLRDAYNALKVPEGTIDKGKLKALIAVCDEILNKGQGSYTAESWNAFTLALEEAKAILAKEDATQPEVDEARNKLDKAHNNLVSIEEEIKALKELIVTCEKYIKEDYTTESWRVFEDALQAAKEVAENPNAALEEIQRAADDLQNAVKALIKVKEGLWTAWAPDSGLTAPENGEGNYHAAYTGKAFKPEILVYDGKTLLKEKTDYTVSYKNNTNAGPATVTVKGKGNYSESTTAEFTIDPIDIATLEIEDLYAAVASNNTKQVALKPIVKFNGKTLKMGKDYTVAYADPNGGKAPGNPSMDYDVKIDAASVNFTGTKMIKMTLVDKDNAYLMSKASIGKIVTADRVYTGEVLKPQITVKYGKTTLLKDTDYTVLYDDEHIEAGETATITIRGNGTTYFGEKTTSFKITGTPLKAGQISLKDVPKTGLVYTGKPQEPEIDGIDRKNYEAVYQNNTNAGTATVVITGKNGYTGTVKKTFKITAYDIFANSDKKFKYNINGSIPFAKGGSKLTDNQTGARFTISDGVEIALQQGKDYTLSYKNNKKVGDNTASVTIKGKGNFKGTLKNIPFTIVAQDLSNLNITAADVLEKNAKKFNKVVPVVIDLDGKTLKNKTDFELDTATAYTDEAGNPISSTEPATGTAVKVTVTGKGNYQGTASAIFHIIDNNMSIAKASVQIEPQRYTGSEVTLSNDQIHVKLKINGTITELQNDNFQIVGYSKNIKKGTAKVTIRGIYPYGGTKTVNFKITARPMN